MLFEATPTTIKLTKEDGDEPRLTTLLPNTKILLERFSLTEAQVIRSRTKVRAGQTLTLEVKQFAAALEEVLSELLASNEDITLEMGGRNSTD